MCSTGCQGAIVHPPFGSQQIGLGVRAIDQLHSRFEAIESLLSPVTGEAWPSNRHKILRIVPKLFLPLMQELDRFERRELVDIGLSDRVQQRMLHRSEQSQLQITSTWF